MKCPQCQRENEFPVPGLCPDCYKQWKEDMRARFGPGPWPSQQPGTRKDSQAAWETAAVPARERTLTASGNLASVVERSVSAVLARLQEPSSEEGELLHQVDALLREVTRMLAQTAAVREEYPAQNSRGA